MLSIRRAHDFLEYHYGMTRSAVVQWWHKLKAIDEQKEWTTVACVCCFRYCISGDIGSVDPALPVDPPVVFRRWLGKGQLGPSGRSKIWL